ncbi:MAG: hypothetical protein A3F69_05790 [Acidobacteria bacterium RIFCSPLOWO2_12_FULL_66_10]|nr:MAG: hypothetical protein A3F69_05790 [Acidobacteria bacterium RIFCSPLOWO2_12_FULL_66_10]
MLPHSYELPVAILIVLGGALSCFAGYRLFKTVLAIYGFIFGAMLASSFMGTSNTTGMIAAALVGGIVGAFVLVLAYFVGIALVGAGLGALVAHFGWGYVGHGDPPAVALILLAVTGAIGAMFLQRYVIIVATAFGGAWTVITGGMALAAARAGSLATGRASKVGDVWIFYPTTVPPGQRWIPIAWIALGVVGIAIQLGVTGKKRK